MIQEKIFKTSKIISKIDCVSLNANIERLPTWMLLSKHGDSLQYSIYADNKGLHIGYLEAKER